MLSLRCSEGRSDACRSVWRLCAHVTSDGTVHVLRFGTSGHAAQWNENGPGFPIYKQDMLPRSAQHISKRGDGQLKCVPYHHHPCHLFHTYTLHSMHPPTGWDPRLCQRDGVSAPALPPRVDAPGLIGSGGHSVEGSAAQGDMGGSPVR